ncbi:hypothetical protein A9Q98_08335 [Thalassotalea sp. 42_200_T64]|nr:hypothetical protein A9Q98_08335 [Thalassotalea sp. 42_200_T64]
MAKYILALLVTTMLLTGCNTISGNNIVTDKVADNRGATLADLDLQPAQISSPEMPELSFKELSATYKTLLRDVSDEDIRAKLEQRYAALSMLESENAQLQALTVEQLAGSYKGSITTINELLTLYPDSKANEQLLYQLAKAYDLDSQQHHSFTVINKLITAYPNSSYMLELQFRRAEILFSEQQYQQALTAYQYVITAKEATPYYYIALYMQGWSYFKLDYAQQALLNFTLILDKHLASTNFNDIYRIEQLYAKVTPRSREIVEETFAVMSMIFSDLYEATGITRHYQQLGERAYSYLSYDALGSYYLQKQRYNDSVDIYDEFIATHGQHYAAASFAVNKVAVLERANFPTRLVNEKTSLLVKFNLASPYWHNKSELNKAVVGKVLHNIMLDFALQSYARAQAQLALFNAAEGLTKSQQQNINLAFARAIHWFEMFVSNFPEDEKLVAVQFHLAESFYQSEQYLEAEKRYQAIAYSTLVQAENTKIPAPTAANQEHQQIRANAAYGLILTLQALTPAPMTAAEQLNLIAKQIHAKTMLLEHYGDDQRAVAVQVDLYHQYYRLAQYQLAIANAEQMLMKTQSARQQQGLKPKTISQQPTRQQQLSARIVIAKSQLALQNYQLAEQAYLPITATISVTDEYYQDSINGLAASIYRQGEAALALISADSAATKPVASNNIATKQRELAVKHFTRVLKKAPESAYSMNTVYDLATTHLALENWSSAIKYLQEFKFLYPQHPLSDDIPAKLAFAFQQNQQWEKAAIELRQIWAKAPKSAETRPMLYLAADLLRQAGLLQQAVKSYRTYAHTYEQPFATAIEAKYILSELYLELNDKPKRNYWLQKLITADAQAKDQRIARSRYLAAMASLEFAHDKMTEFKALKLKLPLSASLNRKRRLLDGTLSAYNQTVEYQVAEFTTVANYHLGEVYRQLASDLMNSERPGDLTTLELEQYEILLEEQSFPFEDKAIAVHEMNAKRSQQGIYDEWVKSSFATLAKLLPGRYHKPEQVVEVVDEIH